VAAKAGSKNKKRKKEGFYFLRLNTNAAAIPATATTAKTTIIA
jgi:hypothetical protein